METRLLIARLPAIHHYLLSTRLLLRAMSSRRQRVLPILVRGTFGMFETFQRMSPEFTGQWMSQDAEDLLSLASMIHGRTEAAHILPPFLMNAISEITRRNIWTRSASKQCSGKVASASRRFSRAYSI